MTRTSSNPPETFPTNNHGFVRFDSSRTEASIYTPRTTAALRYSCSKCGLFMGRFDCHDAPVLCPCGNKQFAAHR